MSKKRLINRARCFFLHWGDWDYDEGKNAHVCGRCGEEWEDYEAID